jgi:membrane protein YdbS with pleckstrin-like domain
MPIVLFRPDIKFRHKLFLNTALGGVIALAGSIALGILIGARIGAREGVAGGAFVGFIVAVLINLAWLIPALLVIPPYYRSLQYEIHDDEVIMRAGVITKTVKHVPLRTVTNLEVKQGPFDRLFGIGTLNIQTAGMGGTSAAEESLGGLRNFQEVYDQVAAALRRYRGAMAPTQA